MRKAFALVSVTFGVDAEKLTWEDFCKKFGEAMFVKQLEADLIAQSVSKIFQ